MVNVQKYKQKAENFLVLFDSSETMAGKVGEKQKLAIAKDAVTCMNQCMHGDVKLTGGLRTFGHGYYLFSIFQTDLIYGMTAYSQDGLKGALCKIDLASGNTPMVKAINAAAEDLEGVAGPDSPYHHDRRQADRRRCSCRSRKAEKGNGR